MKKIATIGALLLMVFLVTGCNLKDALQDSKDIGKDAAKAKVESFIKGNLVAPGTDLSVGEIIKEGSLYKIPITIKVQGQSKDIISYVSQDGTKFFPEMIEIRDDQKKTDESVNADENQPSQEITKNDKPEVEVFVMAHCPYGTQIEKGIIPVIESLGAKIKFNLRFVSYTMHGDKEANENMRQYCIQKNEPAKLLSYLKCFLKSTVGSNDEAESCIKSIGVSKVKIDACIASSNTQFDIKAGATDFPVDKEANTKYGVQGSPTLVINGTVAQSGRDSAGLLKTICSAFNKQPAECQKQLSSASPAPGFGEGTVSGASDASCGN